MTERFNKVRNCPVCRTGLRELRIRDVSIDFCPFCRGSWFDLNELQLAYGARQFASPLLMKALPDLMKDSIVCESCKQHTSRLNGVCTHCNHAVVFSCPSCRKSLDLVEKHGLSVDCCRNCNGVWLDGGELVHLFEQYSKEKERPNSGGSVVGGAADTALDMFIWAPDLTILATAQILRHVPDLASKGLEVAGNMPEIAGKAAEGVMHAAGAASDLAGSAITGAFEVAGNVGGAAADAAGSFIEAILDIISGIFD